MIDEDEGTLMVCVQALFAVLIVNSEVPVKVNSRVKMTQNIG